MRQYELKLDMPRKAWYALGSRLTRRGRTGQEALDRAFRAELRVLAWDTWSLVNPERDRPLLGTRLAELECRQQDIFGEE
jgi:hypothetical protein